MTSVDTFATPDDLGPIRASELHEGLGASLGATAAETLDPQSGVSAYQLWRRLNTSLASHPEFGPALSGAVVPGTPTAADIPDVPIADAKARVKQEGLEGQLPLPDQPWIKQPVLDLMLNEAHEHRNRQVAIARGPQGFGAGALGFATSIGAGMIDPINIAAFSVPVLGEARWGRMMASAGDSMLARAGVRSLQGAAQGAAGTALLQPADWWFHTADGRDYTMADALRSVALGAGMGAAFHAGIGAVGDVRSRMRGEPLPGSADETLTRAPQPETETQLEGRGGPFSRPDEARSVEGAAGAPGGGPLEPVELPAGHPARVLADLPELAREDAFKAAAADMIAGRPVRVGEMLQEAAKADPRIAETVKPPQSGPQSLLQFIASRGGISSKEPLLSDFLQALGGKKSVKGAGKLVNPDGIPLDRMREAAVEAGYLDDPGRENGGVSESTIRDLIDAVDTEARGQKIYARGEEPVPTQRELRDQMFASSAEKLRHLEESYHEIGRLLDQHGVTGPERVDVQRRAEVIIRREDVRDPTVAVDRALDEFDIQGKRPGVGDADAADWQQFANTRPEYEDPQAVAESNEAARAPEPGSIEPEKATTAAERAAADAKQLLADMKPNLSEEEWRSLEDALANVENEKGVSEQIIRDGAACLAAAVAA